MRNTRKAVSAARAQDDPALGFTAGELNAEMRSILDSVAPSGMQKGDLTVPIAMEYWGLKQVQTRYRLSELVKKGKLVKVQVLLNHKIHVVWRDAKKVKKAPA